MRIYKRAEGMLPRDFSFIIPKSQQYGKRKNKKIFYEMQKR